MGHRVVKRVPMDFDAPLKEVWEGYRSPEWRPCPSDDCDNGQTIARAWVERAASILLLAAEAPDRGLHPWLEQIALQPGVPGQNIKELTGALAGRPYRGPFGHDAIDRWSATKAILRGAGLDEDWGICPVCEGHAIHPDDLAPSEAWEATEPPTGDGWQLWETTSEGSPTSPVFSSAERLADWCAENATPFADIRWTRDEWLRSFLGGNTDADTLMIAKPGYIGMAGP